MSIASTVTTSQLIRDVNPFIKIMHVVNRPYFKQFSVLSTKSSTKHEKSLYAVKIETTDRTITPTSKLKVYCNCLDFRYRLAYCLDIKGALLTQPDFVLVHPEVTNPACLVRSCQHISTALRFALQRKI